MIETAKILSGSLPLSRLLPLSFVDWDHQTQLGHLQTQFYPKLCSGIQKNEIDNRMKFHGVEKNMQQSKVLESKKTGIEDNWMEWKKAGGYREDEMI